MIVSINQPAYMPWLGYFERIANSDLHVVLDHVQFEKNSFVNRNKIRTNEGSCWLTIPLLTKGKFGDLALNTVEINPADTWKSKHWKSLQMQYGKAPFFADHADFFEELYSKQWPLLAPLCRELTAYLLQSFGISTELMYSSDMTLSATKSELVLEICTNVHATKYISGTLGKDYLEIDLFTQQGIEVEFQEYAHPEYSQLHAGPFEPYMAAIDLLFNHGPDSYDILCSSQPKA